MLERVQWHLEAAEASMRGLEGKVDEVRAALEARPLERALEAALERILPSALQRAVQALPQEGAGAGILPKAPPALPPGIVKKVRSQAEAAAGGEGHESGSPSAGRRQSCHSPSRGARICEPASTEAVRAEGSPSQLALCPVGDRSLASGRHYVCCETPRGAGDRPGAGRRGSLAVSLTDRREAGEGAAACDLSPGFETRWRRSVASASSDGDLALGQWGGGSSDSGWFGTKLASLAGRELSLCSSRWLSGGSEKLDFTRRSHAVNGRPATVRGPVSRSFRGLPSHRFSREEVGPAESQGAQHQDSGGDGSRSGGRSVGEGSSLKLGVSTRLMAGLGTARSRSQRKRTQQRLNTRKARCILYLCTFFVLINALWVGLRSHFVMRNELLRHGIVVHWDLAGLPSYELTKSHEADDGAPSFDGSPAAERERAARAWGHAGTDAVFTLMLILEFGLRIWLFRWEFVRGEQWRWNVFDSILVLVTVVHWFINVFLIGVMHVNMHRLPRVTFLRILRLPRAAIDFSHLDCIHSLQLMTASIMHSLSFSSVAFAVVVAIIYLFSVCFVQGIIDLLEGATAGSIGEDALVQIAQTFGSVQITLLSLFQAISGGIDWKALMVPLSLVSWRYTLLLFLYIFVVLFGLLNIVASMFVECVCQVTKENYRERIRSELIAQNRWMEQLRDIFVEADEDESGGLSWNEFSALVDAPMMRAYFTTLELNIEEAKEIFEYLDVQGEGEVTMQDFVCGCVCLRGEAKSVDLAVLRSQWQRTSRQLSEDMQHLARLVEDQSTRLSGVTITGCSDSQHLSAVPV